LNIESLYTNNIPTKEAINILIDKIFTNDSTFHGFSRDEFKQLLILASDDVYFFFNDLLYQLVDSLAMGSPLSALLANAYLSYYESQWLNTWCIVDERQ